MINSRLESLAASDHLQASNRKALSRSYGRCFAEFLKLSYPEHLRILFPPTLVGLRYGYNNTSPLRFFLAARVIKVIPTSRDSHSRFQIDERICLLASYFAWTGIIDRLRLAFRDTPRLAPPSLGLNSFRIPTSRELD